ncbi:MAG TPA: DUF5654 family protein [Ktedonobacterales bacterium]|jgi:cytochrome c oxidase subunit IV|nr:DUF5654 family protein [Ktedonobacterales bacterium]
MQDDPQGPYAGGPPGGQSQQRGRFDPRNYDPRKVVDREHLERAARAQAVARAKAIAKAQATSTVFLATVVSLVTSTFGFVAALAWNTAIQDNIIDIERAYGGLFKGLSPHQLELLYALIVTLLAVLVIIIMNRVASRIAKKSVLEAAEAG